MDMETFKARVENWKDAWPKLTYQALKSGSNLVRDEIKRRWSGPVLKKQSGKLVNAVQSKVKLNPLSAKVEVASRQQYKAQTHEYGKTIIPHPRAYQFKRDKEGVLHKVNIPKNNPYLVLGPPDAATWGRPRSVTIPARPVWFAVKQSKVQYVLSTIEKTIVGGWQKA